MTAINTAVDYRDVAQLFSSMKLRDGRCTSCNRVVLTDGTVHDVTDAVLNDLARQIRLDDTRMMKRLFTGWWDHEYSVAVRQTQPEPAPVAEPQLVLMPEPQMVAMPAPSPVAVVDYRRDAEWAYSRQAYLVRQPRRRNPITGHFIGGGRGER